MTQHDVPSKLAKVPIFSECTKRELNIIARASKEVPHKAGTVIAREGERGIGLFLILEGDCRVSIGGKTKAKLGPGDFFGEVALLDGGPRTATVIAETPMTVLTLERSGFRRVIESEPEVAVKILASIATMLRRLQRSTTG